MKFVAAIIVYLLMGLGLVWGLLHVMQGSYWLLAVGFLAYLVAFVRNGCTTH